MKLLEVQELEIRYRVQGNGFRERRYLQAVNQVSFELDRGRTIGLVGESGCGKSSLARSLVLLEEPTNGEIRYQGRNILNMNRAERKDYRRSVQMIFQDPYGSLNPKLTVEASVAEGIRLQGLMTKPDQIQKEVIRLLEKVGLDASATKRYPRQFSGGQRQRIGIARALAVRPELIVCDEPVSALDVSVQAQVINLLRELQTDFQLSYLFITHDLAVVENISHELMVMYLGQIVEQGPAKKIISQPKHPYSQMLIASIPGNRTEVDENWPGSRGDIPSPLNVPPGCPFHSRCPLAEERCRLERPLLKPITPRHHVACHLVATED